tara:strand:- start:6032 stop:7405 length:1374 start_codon:yes stop_codon:yes gene_type:complete
MSKSLVTIYITNYNYGRYIKQSIESVLSQSYRKFELLIIDDGSSDNSLSIINEYIKNKRIKLITQKRKGLNKCNNIALKNSNGKYIVRLDADDYFLPIAIEKMVNHLDNDSNAALVFADYHLVDMDGVIIHSIRRHNFENEVTLFDQPAHGACTMIRKSYLEHIGGYDESFDRQDGYDLWLKIINNYKIKNINEPLFCYRQHGSNLTNNSSELFQTRAKIKEKFVKNNNYKPLDIMTLIPARGLSIDSTSNHLDKLSDKCIINWTIDSAINSQYCKNIIVSTPDPQIKDHVDKSYNMNELKTINRDPELARLNVGIEGTVEDALSYYENCFPRPDAILILYDEYPFKKSWQIDEVIHTMQIFNVDVVDGIKPDNRFYYKHDGGGLKPTVDYGGLQLERDQLYRRVGGVHLIKTDFFLKNKKMIDGKIGHIHFDQLTAFQIKSKLDLEIAQFLASKVI